MPVHHTGAAKKLNASTRRAKQTQLSMATAESSRTGARPVYLPQHIVVLVHGNNGSAADFDAMETALRTKFGERQMLIVKSRANEPDTSLGVEIGGTRLAKEVVDAVFQYDLSPVVSSYKLSVVGHSLGGLYARYALVQIMDALSCLHVEYVDFVTICTPHLGSRRARGPSTMKVRDACTGGLWPSSTNWASVLVPV
jgi:pimeloyl-ACP methyl ester carboxylesterase